MQPARTSRICKLEIPFQFVGKAHRAGQAGALVAHAPLCCEGSQRHLKQHLLKLQVRSLMQRLFCIIEPCYMKVLRPCNASQEMAVQSKLANHGWTLTAELLSSRDLKNECNVNGLTSPLPNAQASHSAASTCSLTAICSTRWAQGKSIIGRT